MGNFTNKENEILNALVSDCINYGLSEKEALIYIKSRLGREISADAYYRRKKNINSDKHVNEWINQFSRIGFVLKHKSIIEILEGLQHDTLKDYLIENSKSYELKNKNEIYKLRY